MPAAIAGALFTVGTIGYAVVYVVVSIAISYGLNALSQSLAGKPKQESQGPTTRDINVKGTTEFGQIIYGEVQVSGYIAFIGCSGLNNAQLWFVIVVANHQCDAITDCWLDDRIVPNADINVSTGAVATAAFNGKLQIWKHLGAHNQTADSNIEPNFQEWTTNHRAAGVAYVVYCLTKDETVWPGGAPAAFMELVKGKRVYDPRLDSTNGGSGSQRYTDATTWAWSNNPALCCRDYITGGSYWYSTATPATTLGIGEPNARINDAYDIAAANVCEEQCNIPLGFAITPGLVVTGTGLSRTVTKNNGVVGWGTDRAYFSQPLATADLTIAFANITTNAVVGLDGHPQDSLGYTTIDYAWHYSTATSSLHIYENGTDIGTYGSYTVGTTVLKITYDGMNVRYYKDGAVQRTVARTGYLYVTSSLYNITTGFTATLATCTQNRYTCDTQLSCGDTHMQNMTVLLSAMNGHVSYANGKYRFYAGAYDTPSITVNADDVLDDMELSTHPNGENLYNYVTGTFYDEDRNWKSSTFPAQTQSTYQTDDNGLYIRTLDLRATRQNYRAQRMANVVLNQSRNKIAINFSALSPKAINISEWETFYLTLPEYGYSAQVFRCLEWKFLQSGLISMVARIDNASSYADLGVGDYTDPASNQPPYSQAQLPETPTALALTSFPTYIKADVTMLDGALWNGEVIELWESTSSSPFSGATKIDEGAKFSFTIPKRNTTTRYYWVRSRLNGQVSGTYPASTGSSAAADLTQTTDVATDAVTDNLSTTVSSVSLTTRKHTPDGFTWNTDVATLSYTPAVNVTATLTVTATVTFNVSASASGLFFYNSIQDSASFDGASVQEVWDATVAGSGQRKFIVTLQRAFSLTAGVAKTFKYVATMFNSGDSCDVANIEMGLVARKR